MLADFHDSRAASLRRGLFVPFPARLAERCYTKWCSAASRIYAQDIQRWMLYVVVVVNVSPMDAL
jgi:hypothetical protein